MKVAAVFSKDGRYHIDAVIDAEHLPPGTDLARLGSDFRGKARIAFDGEVAPLGDPEILDAPGKIAMRFSGPVPAGAEHFTWSQGLRLGPYLYGARNEGDAAIAWQWLEDAQTSAPAELRHAPPPISRAQVVRTYLALGFTHILPRGLDHILFVLGLFLLSLSPRTILQQVTAFTVAHSITLALSLYGVVSLSPRIVEPLIALSIVYVALENLVLTSVKPWRLALVFAFGLLHGMGFAGVLRELGLPRSEFLTGLVSFNVGVEAGQLSVIALAYLGVGIWFGGKPWYRARLAAPASAAIALVGLYWTFERVLG